MKIKILLLSLVILTCIYIAYVSLFQQCIPDCKERKCGQMDKKCGIVCDSKECQAISNGICKDAQCTDVVEPCRKQCSGKQCGDDGCGGKCGNCPGILVCRNGTCCTPNCIGKCSGSSDGCGGVCNANCPSGQVCRNGTCCTPDCVNKCNGEDDGCGGVCSCPLGKVCNNGFCCTPNCTGKCRGASDGCGGICNTPCNDGQVCNNGTCCTVRCKEPDGVTNKPCGSDDGCGGKCVTDTGCGIGQICIGTGCCTPNCTGKCIGASDGCGRICDTNQCANASMRCGFGGNCYSPQCVNSEGKRKCDGTSDGGAGNCLPSDCKLGPESCINGFCCDTYNCSTQLNGQTTRKQCGDNGCGGVCGNCAVIHDKGENKCVNGICTCDAAANNCNGNEGSYCGPTCNGSGRCQCTGIGLVCSQTERKCVRCVPNCKEADGITPKPCGSADGCGSFCSGICPDGQVCYMSGCCTPNCKTPEGKQRCLGSDGCGGFCRSTDCKRCDMCMGGVCANVLRCPGPFTISTDYCNLSSCVLDSSGKFATMQPAACMQGLRNCEWLNGVGSQCKCQFENL